MIKAKVENIKDKIDGNELDLSLSNLTEVPVKELAAFPKATFLDLSCNNLTTLTPEFCSLTHLIKIDLSKNQLICLPEEIGQLLNLQHLDLYNNKLKQLPVGFSQLKSLKWLDLKDNPLESTLAKAAGDCLDEKQCKQCASRVLQHMKVLQEEAEKERERRLLKERDKEIKLVPASNSSKATQVARESILTQGEWEFLNISVSMEKDSYEGQTFDRIKYTISVRRMPLMHFINFQLPILFFLILDLASFFIPDRGEKLCFKVTVLLGISVLLLILNDILPSKSHRCPLIATYVIVIFSFMLLSLLETILVIYLINMSSEQDTKWVQRPEDAHLATDKCKGGSSDHICFSGVEAPLESLMLKEICSKEKINDMHLLQQILEELQTIKQTLVPHTLKAQTGQKYWLGVVKCINRLFFVVYLVSISLFLGFIFREWKVE